MATNVQLSAVSIDDHAIVEINGNETFLHKHKERFC